MSVDNEHLILKGVDDSKYVIPIDCIEDVIVDSENKTIKIEFRPEVWSVVGCRGIKFKYPSSDAVNKIADDYYSKKYAGWF